MPIGGRWNVVSQMNPVSRRFVTVRVGLVKTRSLNKPPYGFAVGFQETDNLYSRFIEIGNRHWPDLTLK